ncbi:MAG TPA: hypothetical protein VNJ02_17770, partial [Vicinamibacterales bacterium]|nr:hypothetical protein [Vicinamibacterales bacterium]
EPMTIKVALHPVAIDKAMDTFRADYDRATERDAARMTADLLAQGATVAWTEYQARSFIEQRLDDREWAVTKLRADLTTFAEV